VRYKREPSIDRFENIEKENYIILLDRETTSTLSDLSPGATYEIQLYTVNEHKESQVVAAFKLYKN
jgi:hypothetical protein